MDSRDRQRAVPDCETLPLPRNLIRWPLVLLLLLTAFTGQWGCSRLDSTVADTSAWELPEQQLFSTTMRFYDLYGLQGELTAQQVDQYLQRALYVMPRGFTMVTWDSLGNENVTITADSGTIAERERDVRAAGNVVVTSREGLRLETPTLQWDNRRRRIITEDSVCFTTATDTLYGIGFVSNRDLTTWEIGTPIGRSYRQLEEEDE